MCPLCYTQRGGPLPCISPHWLPEPLRWSSVFLAWGPRLCSVGHPLTPCLPQQGQLLQLLACRAVVVLTLLTPVLNVKLTYVHAEFV